MLIMAAVCPNGWPSTDENGGCIQSINEGRTVAFDLASCIMPMLAVPAVSDEHAYMNLSICIVCLIALF
jgi:hypothetical protein